MKIYLDTGNVKEIAEATRMGILDGVTTNPSLVSKEGRDFKDLILEICQLVDGPVSAEVVSVEAEAMVKEGRELARIHPNAMVKEGRELARIHPNVVVKCPLIPEGLAATKRLSGEGIRVNVTLCFADSSSAGRESRRVVRVAFYRPVG
jgi:transaldolase